MLLTSCAKTRHVTPELYVAEFLTEGKSSIAPRGWAFEEQVLTDKQLLHELHESSPQLLAVAILNAGIHPRWTMLFLDDGSDVRVVATLAYWGQIQEKLGGQISRAEYSAMLDDLLPSLECGPQMESNSMMRGFVHWGHGEPAFCDANPWGDDGVKLGEVLYPLLRAADVRFTVFKERAGE